MKIRAEAINNASIRVLATQLLGFLALALSGAGCGGLTRQKSVGSETHFLGMCTDGCGGGLVCLDGLCSLPCQADEECSDLSARAACLSGGSSAGVCGIGCFADSDCGSDSDGLVCVTGRCEQRPRSLVDSATLSDMPTASHLCDWDIAAGRDAATPVAVRAVALPLASQDFHEGYAAAEGMYWVDPRGGVFLTQVNSDGEGSTQRLADADDWGGPRLGTSIALDGDRVWGTTIVASGVYRVWWIDKSGGERTIAYEGDLLPFDRLGVLDGQLLLKDDRSLLRLDLEAGSEAEPVLMRDSVYSELVGIVDGRLHLVHSAQQGAGTVEVFDLEGQTVEEWPFRLPPEWPDLRWWSLTQGPAIMGGPGGRVGASADVPSFVRVDLQQNCLGGALYPQVGRDEFVGAIDERFVYWMSSQVPDGVEPGAGVEASLFRSNLVTGRVERLESPNLQLRSTLRILGHNEGWLFASNVVSGASFAVEKP